MVDSIQRFRAKYPAKRGDMVLVQYQSKELRLARAHRIYNGYATEIITHPNASPEITHEGLKQMNGDFSDEFKVTTLIERVFVLDNPQHSVIRKMWYEQRENFWYDLGNDPNIARDIFKRAIREQLTQSGLVVV